MEEDNRQCMGLAEGNCYLAEGFVVNSKTNVPAMESTTAYLSAGGMNIG